MFIKSPVSQREVLFATNYQRVGRYNSILALGVMGHCLVGMSEMDREVYDVYARAAPAGERPSDLRRART